MIFRKFNETNKQFFNSNLIIYTRPPINKAIYLACFYIRIIYIICAHEFDHAMATHYWATIVTAYIYKGTHGLIILFLRNNNYYQLKMPDYAEVSKTIEKHALTFE